MKKKILKDSLKENSKDVLILSGWFVGVIISFLLSIYVSDYFYFLSIPILCLFFLVILVAWASIEKSLKRKSRDEKYFYDGHHKIFFEKKKNQVSLELNILKGKRHGLFIDYYMNGRVQKKCYYKNGIYDGAFITFYENGELSLETEYNNGKLNGYYKAYFENGKLKFKTHYKNGVKSGEWKEFHENGELKFQTKYNNGVQQGETKSYYNNGNIYRSFKLSDGNIEGEIKEFHKNGDLNFICINESYTFYKNDNIACKIEINFGERDLVATPKPKGIWKNYREDGTLDYELDFNIKNSDRVFKTIFTKGGEFYSKNEYGYKTNKIAGYNFKSSYSRERHDSKTVSFPNPIGPPGPGFGGSTVVKLKPIETIEDIIELTPIK